MIRHVYLSFQKPKPRLFQHDTSKWSKCIASANCNKPDSCQTHMCTFHKGARTTFLVKERLPCGTQARALACQGSRAPEHTGVLKQNRPVEITSRDKNPQTLQRRRAPGEKSHLKELWPHLRTSKSYPPPRSVTPTFRIEAMPWTEGGFKCTIDNWCHNQNTFTYLWSIIQSSMWYSLTRMRRLEVSHPPPCPQGYKSLFLFSLFETLGDWPGVLGSVNMHSLPTNPQGHGGLDMG